MLFSESPKHIRLLTGFVVALITFISLIKGGFLLFLLLTCFICIGLKEYVDILKNKGFLPFFKVIITATFLMLIATASGYDSLLPVIISGGVIASFLAVLFRGRQPYIANVATTILGFTFAWLPSYLLKIRNIGGEISVFGFNLQTGLLFLLFLFFVILATDTAAYYFGVRYGKHKLSPVISPKKSVEGSIAGSCIALLTALIIGWIIGINWQHSLVLGALITCFAQLGDLSESLIKRDAGVKDSGTSLPGHGGILDRADSYLFTAPVAYFYIKYVILTDLTFTDISEFFVQVCHAIGY